MAASIAIHDDLMKLAFWRSGANSPQSLVALRSDSNTYFNRSRTFENYFVQVLNLILPIKHRALKALRRRLSCR